MELFLALVVVGVAWYFLSGAHSTMHRNPATLPEADLEDVFLEIMQAPAEPALARVAS